MKKGFSLSELLIGLTVVGILVAILAPIAKRLLPNENVLRTKKAFHVASVIVNEMVNDENCYPDVTYKIPKDDEGKYIGFHNLVPEGLNNPYKYPNCKGWSADGDEYNADGTIKTVFEGSGARNKTASCRRGRKFIKIFMDKLGCRNIKEGTSSDGIPEVDTECYDTFYICETPDKMVWTFRNPKDGGNLYGYVDVNGPYSPNRRDSGQRDDVPMWDFELNNYYFITLGKRFDSTANKYDTFRMVFNPNGTITVSNPSAQKALYTDDDVR